MRKKFQLGSSYTQGPIMNAGQAPIPAQFTGNPNPYAYMGGQGMGIAPDVMDQRALSSANVLRNFQQPNLTPNIDYNALENRFPIAQQSITQTETGRNYFGGIDANAMVGFGAANTLLSFLANRNTNREQDEYMKQNLFNPYMGTMPSNNGRSDQVKYGYKNYQQGGQVEEDILDELFEEIEDSVLAENPSEEELSEVEPPTQSEVDEAQAEATEEASRKAYGFQLATEPLRRQSRMNQYEQESFGNFNASSPALDLKSASNPILQAHQYYTQKGVPAHISAGILGNLMQESNLNPNAVGDGGQARGIAQWHPGRYKGLQNFAARTGRQANDLTAQLDYILQEPGESSRVLQRLMQTSTPEEAAVVFSQTYERPSAKYARNDRRAGYAKSIFNKK